MKVLLSSNYHPRSIVIALLILFFGILMAKLILSDDFSRYAYCTSFLSITDPTQLDVLQKDGDLYVRNLNGECERRLTFPGEVSDWSPSISADSRKVLFLSGKRTRRSSPLATELYMLDIKTRRQTLLVASGDVVLPNDFEDTIDIPYFSPVDDRIIFFDHANNPYVLVAPRRFLPIPKPPLPSTVYGNSDWLPDGKRLVFDVGYEDEILQQATDVFMVDAPPATLGPDELATWDFHLTQLTDDGQSHLFWADDETPQWESECGGRLRGHTYPHELQVFIENDNLYIANPDGSKKRKVICDVSEFDRSSDRRRIIVGYYVIDLATGEYRGIAEGTGTRASSGIFSPVDDRIVFQDYSYGIYLLQNKDLAVPVYAGDGRAGETYGLPAWSPDGRKLAFTVEVHALTPYTGNDIFIVDIPPASFTREEINKWDFKPRQITFNGRSESPSWTPDGKLHWETVTYEE